MAFTKINTRSPFFVSQTEVVGETITVHLFLWNESGSEPSTPTKILSKPIPSSTVLTVDFDISPYINAYIEHTVFTPVSTLTATDEDSYSYCRVRVYKSSSSANLQNLYFIGYKGYGYFEDGMNPVGQVNIMLDEGEYYCKTNSNNGGLYYHQDDAAAWSATHVSLDGTTASVTNALTLDNGYIPYIPTTHLNTGGSILTIKKDTVIQRTFTFREVCEPKYTPLVCDFVNRYGVWQTIIFFKVSKSKIAIENIAFNMMPTDVDYSTSKNIRQTFNTNGQESITVNTGWVLEHYSEVMQQLLLSNTIRLDNRPVIAVTKSLDMFTSINERNINYTLDFNYANPIINNIQ